MARTKISEFSATAANNTDIDNIDIAEGCAPSGINNAIRELMAQLKDFQAGTAGDPFNGAVNGTVGATTPAAGTFTNLAYTGTLTGGTGVINIGSGQFYKDGSGNVGIGTSSPISSVNYKTLTISGTNGGQLALAAGGSAQGYLYSASTAPFVFYNAIGASEAARIDSSGNVGIGTTAPLSRLDVRATGSDHQLRVQNTGTSASDDAIIQISTSSTGTTSTISGFYFGDADDSSSGQLRYNHTNDSMAFYTSTAERMRISSGGELSIGKTVNTATGAGLVLDDAGLIRITRDGTTSSTQMQFNNNGGTQVGTITTSGSATAYNTSSDYRLKENVQPMQNALATVAALKPCTYTWKADGSEGQGFIAHELQAVVPDCVTGEKDAVDADGKPQYQGVDTSFLVGILTKAIQEQQSLITDLQTRLTALEGN